MNANPWSQYVSMDDGLPEPGMLDAALECMEDWDDEDLELTSGSFDDAMDDLDDGLDA